VVVCGWCVFRQILPAQSAWHPPLRDAAVDGNLQDCFYHFFLAATVVQRTAHMQFQLVRAVQCGNHAQVDQAARFARQSFPCPHRAPAIFSHQLL
jgi:hypothetical protein